MPYYCTVPRCTSMAGKVKNVSFHQFPRDEELAKLWNKILKRGKPYTKYSKVCSLHFTPEDYTITSVGKNKGQWRTLRKDAIPSQNLPSESPTPYQRKQWGSWTQNVPANILDPTIQQQMAQAIYMQTMLAMQAAGNSEMPALTHNNGLASQPNPTEAFAHTSHTSDTDILKGKQTNTEKSTSYKCMECSKCFKDPDVFILHKRSHIKNEKNEKENFNLNLTLQANPILANLLKTNTENSTVFDNNVLSVESLLMTALAANMEGYMRNFTSMIKNEDRGDLNYDSHDRDGLGYDRGNLSHDRDDLSHDRIDLSHANGSPGHDLNYRGGLSCDRNNFDNRGSLGNDRGDLSHDVGDLGQERDSLNRMDSNRDSYIRVKEDLSQRSDFNCDRANVINLRADINNGRVHLNNDSTEPNSDSLIRDRIIELYRNNDAYENDRNIRYHENDSEHDDRGQYSDRGGQDSDRGGQGSDRGGQDSDRGGQDSYRGGQDSDRGHNSVSVENYDDTMGDDSDMGVTNDDDSHGTEPICDSDLNESVDSNKLVIDETV